MVNSIPDTNIDGNVLLKYMKKISSIISHLEKFSIDHKEYSKLI